MDIKIEHLFFLDRHEALTQYEQTLEVTYDNNCRLRQFCYYLCEGTEQVQVSTETPYLIGLSQDQIVSFFKTYLAYPIPTQVITANTQDETLKVALQEAQEAFLEVFLDLERLRRPMLNDALFTQPVMAEWMAKQQIKIHSLNPHIPAKQLCYVIGEPPKEGALPPNLIYLPEENMIETISEVNSRPPKSLIISPFDSEALVQQGRQFLDYIQTEFNHYTSHKFQKLVTQAQQLRIAFPSQPSQPLRVMVTASYYTTVMRYALESMAQAFKQLGCDVLWLMDDEYSHLTALKMLEAYCEFQPHLTFNINHLNNMTLSVDTFNLIWWQDLMPPLREKGAFNYVRPRDFHYAFGDYILEAVQSKGVEVQYQEQCADEQRYYPPEPSAQRREVIVFVGTAYAQEPEKFKTAYGEQSLQTVLKDYEGFFQQEFPQPQQRVEAIHRYVEAHSEYDQFQLTRLWIYYCRTTLIYHLIDTSPYPIELYGYDWQKDPKTAPYYQGHIENGEALADLYRSVKYGLSVQPFMTGHQRLAEIKFCGAIPLVYWTPNRYEHSDYQDEVLAFESLETLDQCLLQQNEALPDTKIRQYFSYVNFAQRCLDQVQEALAQQEANL